MKKSTKEFLLFLIFAINVAFAIGIVPVFLFSWKIIKATEVVLIAYQFVAVSSPLVIGVTLIRWLKKFPIPLTWLQAAYGVTAICTWIYSSIVLIRFYGEGGASTDMIAAILVVPVAPLTALAIYLSYKAYMNRFEF